MAETSSIGLALSGGGFRATLFHLGVIKFLRESGRLKSVKRIGAVSGGSVLAAHLVLNWERYTGSEEEFESAAKELIGFCRYDVRGRVLRRHIMGWVMILPQLLRRKHWALTHLLQKQYSRIFKNAVLGDLKKPNRPQVFFNCTSLSTGAACAFGRSGFMWYDGVGDERRIVVPELPVAFAVTASSAFPPLFPPVAVTHNHLFCRKEEFNNPHQLTDGGVYDNLGINRLLWYHTNNPDLTAFYVSDAEGNFDWEFESSYNLLSRNVRASSVLMKRISALQYEAAYGKAVSLVRFDIGEVILDPNDPSLLSPSLQKAVSNIRTDLDGFTDLEVRCLLEHGYAVARNTLTEQKSASGTGSELAKKRSSHNIADMLKRLKASHDRRLGLWSIRDWSTWVTVPLMAAYFLAFPISSVEFYKRWKVEENIALARFELSNLAVESSANPSPISTTDEHKETYERNVSAATARLVQRVYIHVPKGTSQGQADPVPESVAQELRKAGYFVPAIEAVPVELSPKSTEIRYFLEEDKARAETLSEKLRESKIDAKVVFISVIDEYVRPQQFELWFALAP